MKKIKDIVMKHKFITIILVLSIIKQIMVSCLPLLAISNGTHDDMMMVNMAENLLNGHWLGIYSQYTLVKGIFFPAFLALSNFIGISYINAANLLYTLACIFFIYAIKDFFKEKNQKKFMLIIFIILLFNPVSYASWTLQRVYRNGVTLAQVLFIFGGYFAVFLKRKENIKKSLFWICSAGIALATFFNTREDAIWILPFILVVTIILIGIKIIDEKGVKQKITHSLVMAIPIITLFVTNLLISSLNYYAYGIFTTNELNDSNFKNAMQSIYSVKNNEDIEYVSVTREKVKRLYKMSPSLNSIKDELEASMDAWSKLDRNPDDDEVEDGWFFWSLRDAVSNAGYYENAKKADNFYIKVSDEINSYVEENDVKTVMTMPSALMSPWRVGYTSKLINTSLTIFDYITSFDEVVTENPSSIDDGKDGLDRFRAISNEAAYANSNLFYLRGYVFSLDDEDITAKVYTKSGKFVKDITFDESDDVYSYYDDKGKNFENAKKCRFDIILKDITEPLELVIYNSRDEKIATIDITDRTIDNDEDIAYNIDNANYLNTATNYQKNVQKYVDRLNFIGDIYKVVNPILFVISIVLFVIITINVIINLIKKKYDLIPKYLILSSVLLSLIVLVFGVSYNEIASCDSIRYMYLSGAYPLLLIFELLVILGFYETYWLNKSKKDKEKIAKKLENIFIKVKGNVNKLSKGEKVFLIVMFVIMFLWALASPYNYGPDEYMRYLVPKYIYLHGTMPLPDDPSVVVTNFNASYAYYPLLLGSVISALFMKITSFFTTDAHAILVASRFTSVIFGVLFIYFMIKIAKKLFPNNRLAKNFMIVFSSLIPQLTFLSSYVNNDIIALAGCAMLVYAFLLLKDNLTLKASILYGISISIIALSYYNAYAYVLGGIIYFILIFVKKKDKKLSFEGKKFFKYGLLISLIVIVLCGYFFIRTAIVNDGDFLGMDSFLEACENTKDPNPNIKPSTRDTPKNLGMSMWEAMWTKHYMGESYVSLASKSFVGVFGYMNYPVNESIYTLYFVIVSLGLIGFLIHYFSSRKDYKKMIFYTCLIISGLITIFLGIYYMYATDYQPQGRYLYPMFTSLSIFVALGINKLLEIICKKLSRETFALLQVLVYIGLIILLVIAYISANMTFVNSI